MCTHHTSTHTTGPGCSSRNSPSTLQAVRMVTEADGVVVEAQVPARPSSLRKGLHPRTDLESSTDKVPQRRENLVQRRDDKACVQVIILFL